MLRVRTSTQIDERISAAKMRRIMGLENVLQTMRYLQLNWLGRVRRMDFDRLPRQLLVSWMPEPRLSNYPQTYSRTVLKALKSVGIPEADWPELAENETGWNAYIRQTAEERIQLCRDNNVNPFTVLAATREMRQQPSAALVRRIEFSLCGCVFPAPDSWPVRVPHPSPGCSPTSS